MGEGLTNNNTEQASAKRMDPLRVPYTKRELAGLQLRRGIRMAVIVCLITAVVVFVLNIAVTISEQVVNGIYQTYSIAERTDRYVNARLVREATYADEFDDSLRLVIYMAAHDKDYQETPTYYQRLRDKLEVTAVLVLDKEGNQIVGSEEDFLTDDLKNILLGSVRKPTYVTGHNEDYCVIGRKSGERIYALVYPVASMEYFLDTSVYLPDLREDESVTVIAFNDKLDAPLILQKGTTFEEYEDEELVDLAIENIDRSQEDTGLDLLEVEDHFVWMSSMTEGDTTIYTLTDGASSIMRSNSVVMLTLLLLLLLLLWAAFYNYQLMVTKIDMEEGKVRTNRLGNSTKKLLVMVVLIVAVSTAATAYLQTLYSLSFSGAKDAQSFENIQDMMITGTERADEVAYELGYTYLGRTEIIADMLNSDPIKQTESELKKLARAMDAMDIAIYDAQGKVITSVSGLTGNLSMNSDEGSRIRSAMRRAEPVILDAEEENDLLLQRTAAPLFDEDGYASGLVMLFTEPVALDITKNEYTIRNLLTQMVIDGAGAVYAVDAETKLITYAEDPSYIGLKAEQIGLTDSLLADDLYTYATLDGERYLVTSAEVNGQYLYSCKSAAVLSMSTGAACWAIAIITLIDVLIVLHAMRSRRKDLGKTHVVHPAESRHGKLLDILDTLREGFEKFVDWKHGSAEMEMSNVMRLLVAAFVLVLFIMVMNPDTYFPRGSIVHYILGDKWKRGVNILAVTAAIIFAVKTLVIVEFIRAFMNFSLDNLTAKGRTIVHTFSSFLQYATIFYLILHTAEYMGANPMAVLTSAGIGLATIGLGAKDAISDIIAGFFIIFEKEYHVGDVVTVNGFTGVIQDMNVRTIRLQATDGNVMIVNNRNVSNVINRTMLDSVDQLTYVLDKKTDLVALKAMLDTELPKLCAEYPALTSEPKLVGISNVDSWGTTIMILVSCHEAERLALMSKLRMRIQVLLQEHQFM